MFHRMTKRVTRALLLAAFAMCSHTALSAQNPGRTAVQVAVPDNFPDPSAKAMIMRFASGKTDVILLRRDNATPEAFAGAVSLLRRLRREHPRVEKDQILVLQGIVPPRGLPPHTLDALASKLADLRATAPARIGNLGTGRWIEIADASLRP